MRIPFLRSTTVFAAALWLTGCVQTPHTADSSDASISQKPAALTGFPDDVIHHTDPAQIDVLFALRDRGLYLNKTGEIKMLDPSNCPVRVVGHRGHFRQPENSLSAIRYGLMSGFDELEIDIRRLKDGHWVLHHDASIGNASGRLDGRTFQLSSAGQRDWQQVRVRDMSTGQLRVDERAPFLTEALSMFQRLAYPNQTLNIELKNDATTTALLALDRMVRATIGDRYVYSSLNLETLSKMRAVAPDVYLGFIQKPHVDSIKKIANAKAGDTLSQKTYARFRSEIEFGGRLGQRFYKSTSSDWTSEKSLQLIQEKLGPNSGLHLDIRRFAETPNVRKRAESLGMQVQTYTINGDEYHTSVLASLAAQGKVPDAVIADSTPYKVCQRLFGGHTPKGDYVPSSNMAVMVSQLPENADLDRLSDQSEYFYSDLYLTLDGRILALSNEGTTVRSIRNTQRTVIKDELLNLEGSEPVLIKIRR